MQCKCITNYEHNYLLSFSADSLGAQRTNNKFGMYVITSICNTNVCTLNLVS
jgi:hypothetical protein